MNIEITRDQFAKLQDFFWKNPGAMVCKVEIEHNCNDHVEACDEDFCPRHSISPEKRSKGDSERNEALSFLAKYGL